MSAGNPLTGQGGSRIVRSRVLRRRIVAIRPGGRGGALLRALGWAPGSALVSVLISALLYAGQPVSALAQTASATDLVQALNAARTLGCGGRPGAAQPLTAEPRLVEAARQLADGLPLSEAMNRSGYRATRASQLWLGGPQGARAITDAVVTNNCAALVDPALTQLGIHQRGRDTWLLLAAPFAPVAPAQAGDVAARVLQRVNAARAQARQCGDRSFAPAGPLVLSERLSAVAPGACGRHGGAQLLRAPGARRQHAERAGHARWLCLARRGREHCRRPAGA
jgi:uncharacterized protein YkwD